MWSKLKSWFWLEMGTIDGWGGIMLGAAAAMIGNAVNMPTMQIVLLFFCVAIGSVALMVRVPAWTVLLGVAAVMIGFAVDMPWWQIIVLPFLVMVGLYCLMAGKPGYSN